MTRSYAEIFCERRKRETTLVLRHELESSGNGPDEGSAGTPPPAVAGAATLTEAGRNTREELSASELDFMLTGGLWHPLERV